MRSAPFPSGRGTLWAVPVCLLLALASLLLPSEPTYDPWAWLVWTRELSGGTLSTVSGPSWKPLPVLLTLPVALVHAAAAPAAWLVLARAGGLLALVMTFRLASRFAGPWAGLLAAGALLLAHSFVLDAARGNSEGLLVALALGALECHLLGGRRRTFALLLACGLLRPEVWPLLLLYGLYLLATAPRRRGRLLVVLGLAAVVLAMLWLGPEYLGSGNALRASDRARQPNSDSAAFAAFPVLEVLRRAWFILLPTVLVAALVATVDAVRQRRPALLALAASAAGVVLLVAVMTQIGYSGNLRYLALPAAALCVLAGVGALRLAAWSRWAAVALAVLTVPGGYGAVDTLRSDARAAASEAAARADLDALLDQAGGSAAIQACGRIITIPFETTALAWRLGVPLSDVGIFPGTDPRSAADGDKPQGEVIGAPLEPEVLVVLRRPNSSQDPLALVTDPEYRTVATSRLWALRVPEGVRAGSGCPS